MNFLRLLEWVGGQAIFWYFSRANYFIVTEFYRNLEKPEIPYSNFQSYLLRTNLELVHHV